jgi:hypothetical protein
MAREAQDADREAAMTCGPVPVRAGEVLAEGDVRTQCNWFSIFQWPRIHVASWPGRAVAAGRLVMA